MRPAAEQWPIAWIDDYVAQIREYVFVRAEDRLLIKVPNESHRLNETGIAILQTLFEGEPVHDFWRRMGGSDKIRRDLYEFFIALKQALEGRLDENNLPGAMEKRDFDLGFNTLPVLSEVALTYRCNLRCRFCYAGCSAEDEAGREMTTSEAKRVLEIIRREAQVPSVSFTGGEPTLRKDLPKLIRHARMLGMRVNLITNGTLVTPRLAKRLAKAGLHSAQVSIEAPAREVHDALTAAPGSFERSLAGLDALRQAGVRVHTNTTMNAANLEALRGMPAFVRERGLERFSMNLVIPCGTSIADRPQDTAPPCHGVNLRYENIGRHVLAIRDEARRQGVEFMWYSPTPLCMFNPIPEGLGNKGCAACDGLLSVSPAGDALPCSSWDEPVGNLLERGFRAVWDSRRAAWIRAKSFAPELCQSCEHLAACQSACPLYWRHFGYEELERHGGPYVAAGCATPR